MTLIGIDVGGTFTDLTAVDDDRGTIRVSKVLSSPKHEASAVLRGLADLRVRPDTVRRIVHGTTVGTNAVLQRQGAKVALITTAGFRDLLEIGRTKRNIPALFNPTFARPKPPVPRTLRFELPERTLADGRIIRPVQAADIDRLCDAMAEERPEAFAVCFLHSYANATHERRVREQLQCRFPTAPISLSSDVVPEYREFERFSTTVLNAYIQPLMERYLDGLEGELAGNGYQSGVLTVGSSGGVLTSETARQLPIKTVFSGPAGGVSQAVLIGRQLGLGDLITYDMGGTSTDVSLVRGLTPVVSTDNLIASFPVKVSQLDIKTVGAGGGSIAWVDVDDSLQVGPSSAGADPGPACYGRGLDPTVTDANLLLGRISTSRPLGGAIGLDRQRAEEAVSRVLARLPGLDLPRVADGIVRIAVARMASSVREITIQRGHDPRDFTFVAFGGAGPMHALAVAEELDIRRVLVPCHAGNFSALGMLTADIKYDSVRTHLAGLADPAIGSLVRQFCELRTAAARRLVQDGFSPSDMRFESSLDLRYIGQAFELNLPVDPEQLVGGRLQAEFHRRHEESYGHADPNGEVEVVNLRLAAYGVVPKPVLHRYRSDIVKLDAARIEDRAVYFRDAFGVCPVYARDRLPAAAEFKGPAIIEEFGATTVILPGWRGHVDAFGNLALHRSE